jgi:hypothetical protein
VKMDHAASKDHSPWRASRNQRCLSQEGMIGLIAILSAFVPISTEIYLPSIPGTAKYFGVSSSGNLRLHSRPRPSGGRRQCCRDRGHRHDKGRLQRQKPREGILAAVQSMVLISPVAAPILGAFILNFTSWRGVFWVLAFIGILAIGGNIALEETINVRYCGSALQVIGRRGTVLRNPSFTSPSSFSPW